MEQDEVLEAIYSKEYEVVQDSWNELLSKDIQEWIVMDDYLYLQLVERAIENNLSLEDKELIDEYSDLVVRNYLKLDFNTTLCGHSSLNPKDYLSNFDIKIEDKELWNSLLVEKIEDDAFSDYGLKPIAKLLNSLLLCENYSLKVQILTEIIGVTHCRGDLSRFFIKTGSKVYNNITVYEDTYA